ncbi:PadR family transcriptional regulator [Demequina sp.]|uniref:PadR family transcriptional regulator n=1 Tax=Demequina sp. TaxID=2050685 RepID=UPI003D1151EA
MGKHSGSLRPLGVVSLALLTERPMHPYEMYQLLIARNQDRTVKVRPGTLYHAINWLEDAGFVIATGTEREGNRPERTTYAITDAGRAALRRSVVSMVTEPSDEYPEFTVAIGEAHNLPAHEVVSALRERIAILEADCARGEALMKRADGRGLPRRFILGGEFALNRARADIAWLSSVIADIESGDLSWDTPVPTPLKEQP